jgi:hypothetical protein
MLRVATDDPWARYVACLYEPLADRVDLVEFSRRHLADPDGGVKRLAACDVFHLHWPEWFTNGDLDDADALLGAIRTAGLALVWTQHNLVPHWDHPNFVALYDRVAAAADVVVHHSESGRRLAMSRLPYGATTRHVVIGHGHWPTPAVLADPAARARRRAITEERLGLPPCAWRVGVLGAPRRDKDCVGFAEGFAASTRDDLGLLVTSLTPDEVTAVPDDPRITAMAYDYLDDGGWVDLVSCVDVVALPFRPGGTMLTTGVVADVVGAGLASLATPWAYLTDTLGDAAIYWDPEVASGPTSLPAVLDRLDGDGIAASAAAAAALRPTQSFTVAAEALWAVLVELNRAPGGDPAPTILEAGGRSDGPDGGDAR